MSKINEIIFIVDKKSNCEKCNAMRNILNLVLYSLKQNITIKEIHWENEEAINVGCKYNLSEIPSCIIGNKTFSGKNYTYDSILAALNN